MGKPRSQLNTDSENAGRSYAPAYSDPGAFADEVNEVSAVLENLPASFTGTLGYHLRSRKVTTDRLAELTNMGTTSVTRYRTDNSAGRKLSAVVLICVALRLNPILSFDLVKKAGFSFCCSREHTAYQMLLLASQSMSVEKCNEYLISIGLKPLSK